MNRKIDQMRDVMNSQGFSVPSLELEDSDLDDSHSDGSLSSNE